MNFFNLFKKNPSMDGNSNRRRFIKKAAAAALGVTMIANVDELLAMKSKTGFLYVKQNGEVINNYSPAGTTPYLGQLMCVGWNFATTGWALCNGQLLPIAQNTALFALLGTTYGGNGQTTFALPDLRGRAPLHFGQGPGLSNFFLGESSGSETHTLSVNEIPSHNHLLNINSGIGTTSVPTNNVIARNAEGINDFAAASNGTMNSSSLGSTGGSQPHNNLQPFLVLNWQIAMQGIFPSQGD
jgi:microcystin-dependent protein